MREILQTDDPFEIALLKSVFEAADIPIFFFDEHASTALGGLGGWTPCRVMVSDSDYEDAMDILDALDEEFERNSALDQKEPLPDDNNH